MNILFGIVFIVLGLFSCSLDYYAVHDYFADTMVAAQKRL